MDYIANKNNFGKKIIVMINNDNKYNYDNDNEDYDDHDYQHDHHDINSFNGNYNNGIVLELHGI